MNEKDPVEIAIHFIEKINRRDFDGLADLMSSDHKAMDEKGEENQGREKARNIIADYTMKYPEFQIHINEIFVKEGMVTIVGRSTGSCTGTSRRDEIRDRLLYTIKVENGHATEFQYAMDDTEERRAELGLADATKITT